MSKKIYTYVQSSTTMRALIRQYAVAAVVIGTLFLCASGRLMAQLPGDKPAWPRILSYQGVLTDANREQVPDGNYVITFKIYSVAEGESPLWQETQTVSTLDGVFDVYLGVATSLDIPFDRQYWIAAQVQGEGEMTPRTRLVAAPYAFTSGRATLADSVRGGVVTSVNGQSGDIALEGAGGTNVSRNGNTIVISSGEGNDASLSRGAVWRGNEENKPAELPIGEPGEVMTVNTQGTSPQWSDELRVKGIRVDSLWVNAHANFGGPVYFDDSVVFNGNVTFAVTPDLPLPKNAMYVGDAENKASVFSSTNTNGAVLQLDASGAPAWSPDLAVRNLTVNGSTTTINSPTVNLTARGEDGRINIGSSTSTTTLDGKVIFSRAPDIALPNDHLWMGGIDGYQHPLSPGNNGDLLVVNGTTPTWTPNPGGFLPAGTAPDATLSWNGTRWVENKNLRSNPTNGNTTIGGNLIVGGSSVDLPANSVDNTELAYSSINVNYGSGVSGTPSVALGGTLNLQNTGVTGLNGTPNQVNVSAATGNITLSTPQDIAPASSPTFAGLNLTTLPGNSTATDVLVSNGGVIESRPAGSLINDMALTQGNIWVGDGSNNPMEIAPGNDGQVLTSIGGSPMWRSIDASNLGLSQNAILVGDAAHHASELGSTNVAGAVFQQDASGAPVWSNDLNVNDITVNGAQTSNGSVTINGPGFTTSATTTSTFNGPTNLNGATTVGGDLTVNGDVNLAPGSIDNSELANSSVNVAYGTGLSGDASVALGGTLNLQNTGVTGAAAGTGIDVSGPTGNVTITNTGVTALAGTANQVNVSAPNGAVTLTLPQDIDANATPTFDGVTLDNLTNGSTATEVVVSNGGNLETRTVNSLVGASTLTENSLWVGNAANNPTELAPGTAGQALRITGSGAPAWQSVNDLPTGSTPNTTLVWNGTAWVENTNVLLNPVSGDITTNGDVTAVEVTTSGNTTVGGDLTVNGTQVNLPTGSIDNSELANSSVNVAYGTGLSGDASVALGGTLNLQNTGVTSLAGTANQVNVSAPNGAVTLTLPQDIDANATPTFDGVTLDNLTNGSTATEVVVSNGGNLETRTVNSLVGASTLTENSLWVGNATNNPTELAPGTAGQALRITGSGAPAWESVNDLPAGTTSNTTLVWNGTQWVENTQVVMNPVSGDITTTGDVTAVEVTTSGNTTVGGDLTVNGTQVTLPTGSVDNSELANSSVNVAYGTGLSGDASVALGGTLNLQNTGVTGAAAGTGIDVSGPTGNVTITNTGVTSLAGTANQVNVSAPNGAVTLTLPQDIDANATPTFDGVTLDNLTNGSTATEVVVSNGGNLETRTVNSLVGASTLTENSLWVGNATNNPTELAPGTAGQALRITGSGAPAWESVNDLPAGTTSNTTLVWNGTAWVENTQVLINPVSGDITTNGDVTAVEVTTSGNTTVGGDLTVNGTQVTLPTGSVDNSELANSSVNVAYGTGLSGDASVALGGTLNLQNTGVTSLAGTANQVNVSAPNGAVTLTLPQDIDANATPTFDGVTLDNLTNGSTATEVVVSNGGNLETRTVNSLVGASTLTENSLWVGNATNNPTELAPGTAGQSLRITGSGAPAWESVNDLPTGTITNTTLRWNGTAWVENTNVTADASGNTTAAGNTMVGGDLTVNGPQVTLPTGSVDNSELANSSVNVAYGTGLNGDASVALGGTLNLQNTGVTSLAGTANQVNVSAPTGSVTLTLPQDIDANATPTFDGVTLDNMTNGSTATEVVVSNGGNLETRTVNSLVGASTLTENSLWVGNATNNPTELAAGTNGQVLQVNGTTPSWETINLLPTGTTSNTTLRWNGTAWVENTNMTADASGNTTAAGNTTVGGDLTVNGTQVTLPNGSVDNSELANSSVNVAYGTGLSGDASVALGGTLNLQNTGVTGAAAGTGIDVSGPTGNVTITNTGVTSLAGTTNQVSVSAPNGAVTLTLPQDIDANATPTFDGVTLDNLTNGSTATEVVVSNGGNLETRTVNSLVGASTLTENSLWVGNATNNPTELAPGTTGQALRITGSGAPAWESVNDLPTGTITNTTLRWNGTAWVENTNVTADASGNTTAAGNTTVGGDLSVNNNLTVTGPQVNLPTGSVDNTELANSSMNVAYGTGLSGDASVSLGGTLNLQNTGVTGAAAGTGIDVSGPTGNVTITNTGVTSLAGTANQVSVSAPNGAVTLTLPQDIDANATPTFDGVTLDNLTNGSTATEVVVSNGGNLETRTVNSLVGASTLTENSLWVGNATNNPTELAPGTNGQVLQVNGTTPSWETINLLPTGTTSNTTLRWNGTAWVENTNVMADASGNTTAAGNTTVGGDLSVNNNLTVTGPQVNLPNGSVDNSELANSSVNVAYGTGLSGDASVALGGTLNLQNTGVTSLAGTANQVSVSAPNGAVTLTLPQDIDANATPTFDGVTLDNLTNGSTATEVVVSNGGNLETRTVNSLVGASTLTENSLWVGNATNNPTELAAGTNGQVLQVNGTTPSWETINLLPTGTTSNTTLVWNGTAWVENTNVLLNPVSGDITTTGDVTAVEVTTSGNTTVGGDLSVNNNLTVTGPQVNLPTGSVDNSELANSSVNVAYGTGLSGDASVALGGTLNLQNTGVTGAAAGTGIDVSGPTGNVTITNTGVTSLAGTTNQVNVSAPNGAVTLTLPQDIDANATPTFDGVTLDNMTNGSTATEVVVSNGGNLETRTVNSLVGASTLTENSLWVGNATNNPTELAAGTNGQVLQVNGTTPSWETINLLPTGTMSNTTLVWNGTAWVENTNVLLNPVSGDITTTGDVTAVEVTTSGNTTVGGDLSVNNNLTVTGPQVNLPNGSVDNSELANSSVNVAYGTGLSGDASVALGGTLNLQNTGVTSLAGTANQVSVSAPNGAVTLTLPQDIDANATPTFDGVTLDNMTNGSTATEVVVSNGGNLETRTVNSLVGASTLTENSLWVGNATNNPTELAPGTNGQVLQVNGTTPSWETINLLPTGTTSNTTLRWNGTAWVENTNVTADASGNTTAAGNTTVGGDLTVNGPQVTLPNGSVDNSELANSSVNVAYGTGLSGDASVALGGTLNLQNTGVTGAAAGTGIDVSGATGNVTITNTGVTSLAGTANQVNVSAPNGAVTLTLPQDIDANATPTFDGVTLDNLTNGSTATEVVVSNGGNLETRTVNSLVGASTLTENSLWVGNATNNPTELAAGTNGQVLQVNGTTPSWETINLLPTGTTSNTTLVWNGTAWVENTQVLLNPVSGDITTNGDVTAVEVTTSGNTTVGGDLTVNGTQVTLPTGSVDNSELANSSVNVAYGTGLSGDASVALGGTLNLQNTGVTSLAGTANQVNVSAPNGAVTLTLPQDIDANATPTFDGVTLDNMTNGSTATEVVVSNGGNLETRTVNSLVGASTLTENSLWVGNATNNPTELAAGTNGQVLQVNGSGTPAWQSINLLPVGTTSNSTLVWNGTQWIENTQVTMDPVSGDVAANGSLSVGGNSIIGGNQNIGGNALIGGNTTISGGLTVSGGPVALPNSSIDNNELANSSVSVAYGTGLSGDASVTLGGTLNLQNTGVTGVAAGTGIDVSGPTGNVTITNTGVTSLAGTANQVNVSAPNGSVTLTLPQDIDANATPTFDGVTLDNMTNGSTATEVVVSNGGNLETRTVNSLVGASTLTENSLWVGNATNNPTELAPGTNGQVLQVNGTTPSWETINLLPTGTTSNTTLVWNGTAWVENTNVLMSPVSGDITTNGDVTAVEVTTSGNTTVGGDLSVNNNLTVTGPQVNLPNGSVDNSELANSSVNVAYGTGLSGDASVALGGTLNLQNTGVTSLAGTANQVSVSAPTGSVTLTLPQDIDANATPTFDGVTLDNLTNGSTATEVVVSNGGNLETRTVNSLVGASTLTENSLWVGNATNNPTELAAGTNGQVLQVNGTTPSWETINLLPTGTTSNTTLVWNGTAWVENTNVLLNPVSGDITTTGDVTAVEVTTSGNTTVGGDLSVNNNLTVTGPQVNLPNGSIDNSELANSSVNVAYGTGLSGDASVALGGTLNLQNTGVTGAAAGTGIDVSGPTGNVTITNTGVTSLAGTTNQVNVSAPNGAVTLTLPQDIDANATPTFDGVTLDNLTNGSTATEVVVSNGGNLETRTVNSLVGASTLTENSLWVGNATNNPTELAPGTNGQVLQVNGTTPSWETINLLPTGTTSNTTLVWNGTAWVENMQVLLNPVSGDITTNGDVTAVEVTTSGNTTVGGDLTVNGTQVTLPNGSVDNTELANSSVNVAYGTGLNGDASVALGGTLNLQNTGVTSLAGTANQVNVSAPNGAVTLTLPQDIDANATPTFDGVTLDNLTNGSTATEVVVSNGGNLETRTVNSLVGASTLTENSLWVGNATNNPTELAAGTNGQVLQVNGSGTPAWQSINLLPVGTTSNSTLVWNGTQWIENTQVTMDPVSGDVAANGSLSVGGNSIIGGNQNIGGNALIGGNTTISGGLTVSGGPVALPNSSIDNNELANSSVSVAYGTGLSGDASVTLGGTLNLQNTGVTSLTGTANQVNVSASTGAITLTLPQNINTTAAPTFNALTLNSLANLSTGTDVVISNGGVLETRTVNSLVGASTLTENSLWVGNGANNPTELGAGSNGQVLQINGSGAPTWQSLSATAIGLSNNAMLVGNVSNQATELPAGSTGDVLTVNASGTPTWGPTSGIISGGRISTAGATNPGTGWELVISEPAVKAGNAIIAMYEDLSGGANRTVHVTTRVVGSSFTIKFSSAPVAGSFINYFILP